MKNYKNIYPFFLIFTILSTFTFSNSLANNLNYTKTKTIKDTINYSLKDYIKILDLYNFSDTLSLEDLFLLSKRTSLRKIYINNLNIQINEINYKIKHLEKYITKINYNLKNISKTYSKILNLLYINKQSFNSYFLFILTSTSINQAYIKLKYIEILTYYLRSLTKTILYLKNEITYQKKIMEKSLYLRKKILLNLYKQKSLYKEDYSVLIDIKEHQNKYKLLKKQAYDYELIRNNLSNTIEQNINRFNITANDLSKSFESYKGKLISPLKNSIIVIPFGVHRHKTFKDIKIRNDGIDITSYSDTIVKSIFEGTVTKIIILPNKKFAVIIKHGDYFTVYSNLNYVYVNEGQKVKILDKIGYISKTNNSHIPILNFQIWYKTTKLNPEKWLNI